MGGPSSGAELLERFVEVDDGIRPSNDDVLVALADVQGKG
jgi:hypothetical protein